MSISFGRQLRSTACCQSILRMTTFMRYGHKAPRRLFASDPAPSCRRPLQPCIPRIPSQTMSFALRRLHRCVPESRQLFAQQHELTHNTLQPMSPTYSFVDDYVFPEPDSTGGMGLAGYSRLFTAGLALKVRALVLLLSFRLKAKSCVLQSRQITRQLDNAYLSLRRVFNWFRR